MQQIIDEMYAALRARNEGRNLGKVVHDPDKETPVIESGCFGCVSFGWKDADLDPHGCCGIRHIVAATDENITIVVSGHKTLCDPTYEFPGDLPKDVEESYQESAHSVVCDIQCEGYWSGDDWSVSFEETVSIHWVTKDAIGGPLGQVIDIDATANAAIKRAREVCKPYQEAWAAASAALDEMYQELEQKYGEGKESTSNPTG